MRYLLVGLGGFLGANARYVVSRWAAGAWPGAFPWGTLLINVSGSFLLGLLAALATARLRLPEEYRLLLAVGFLGAYTTFSTLTQETLELFERGEPLRAAAYVAGSVLLGLLAALLGTALGRAL